MEERVLYLIKKYKSTSPFFIAKEMGIKLIISDMGEVEGCYLQIKKSKFIILNERLSEQRITRVMAHELGHAVLHKEIATPHFMSPYCQDCTDEEIEANEFADCLLSYRQGENKGV